MRKLREGLLDLSAPEYGRMNVAVAYVKETGLDVLDSMKVKIDRGIVGDAFGVTQPEALRRLLKEGSTVRMAQVATGTFHPKLYMVPYDDSLGAIVGSANLTGGGLEANEEASIALRGHNDEAPIPNLLEYFRGLWDANAVVLDEDWIDQYENEYPYKGKEIDENTGASVITDVSLKVAGKQIERAARHWIVSRHPRTIGSASPAACGESTDRRGQSKTFGWEISSLSTLLALSNSAEYTKPQASLSKTGHASGQTNCTHGVSGSNR